MTPDLFAPPAVAGLFSPLRLGAFELQHRVVLTATARRQALAPHGLPTEAMAAHYGERATPGGLLLCEGSAVLPRAHADRCTPGLYSAEQVNLWRATTDAVHARGGIAIAQLGQPVADTRGGAALSPDSMLDTDAVDELVDAYRNAAENAGDAGFDGVELLAGDGALAGPLLHGDDGDPHERLLGDLLQALVGVWGAARCGLCLSPAALPDDGELAVPWSRLLGGVEAQGLAWLQVAAPPRTDGAARPDSAWLRTAYRGAIIASGDHSPASAEAALAAGHVDAVGWVRAFLAHADLPARLRAGLPLAV